MGAQPLRWLFAYICIVITGVATVWYHGFGEQFVPGIADIGTNLLLAWALQVAALGDNFPRRTQLWVALASGSINLAYFVWRISAGPAGAKLLAFAFGAFGGFSVGELLLIADSVFAVVILYLGRARMAPRARSLLYLLTFIFLVGTLFATASNQRVDLQVVAYHATWHIVGAFGFIALWALNHVRFGGRVT